MFIVVNGFITFMKYKYTLNKISNWSLFKLIISDQALKIFEMNFCLNMFSLMSKNLTVFQKSCLSIHSFLVKMQKYAF